MKKVFCLVVVAMFLFAAPAMAAWTLNVTEVDTVGSLVRWKVLCTSDGSAMSATDIVDSMDKDLKKLVQGSLGMVMTVVPGSGGVAPNTTIDITISNDDFQMYADTGLSNTANSHSDLSQDFGQFLPVYKSFKIAINDIGDAGDQVTLYFDCWSAK